MGGWTFPNAMDTRSTLSAIDRDVGDRLDEWTIFEPWKAHASASKVFKYMRQHTLIKTMNTKLVESNNVTLEGRLRLLKEAEHRGPVKSTNPRQKVSDEELVAIFNQVKGKWLRVNDLREALAGLITVNTRNPKRTPINSAYLRRLRNLTGHKWRQKRGADAEGRVLVKIYVRKG